MPLNLMYITNRPEVARIVEEAGVDRIFVDLEYIGKAERQCGMDTVQSRHTLEDVKRIADAVTKAEVLVRVNPIHEATDAYCSSEEEIETAIANGAEVLMLPYFKTIEEVKRFLLDVNGRVKTMLLVETPEAAEQIDEILSLDGIDFVHIGLNDLSFGYKMKFMFQLLADGTVERLCKSCEAHGIPYGFGGIASLGRGMVPAEMVIMEHYRLGSGCAILSRSFCDANKMDSLDEIRDVFMNGMKRIRAYEAECAQGKYDFIKNRTDFCAAVKAIVEK